MNGITEGERQLPRTSVNQVPDVEHVLVTAGTEVHLRPHLGMSPAGQNTVLSTRAISIAYRSSRLMIPS